MRYSDLPLIAATSAHEIVEQIQPYADAGATRIILPYVAATDDVIGEMKSFIEKWNTSQPSSPRREIDAI